MEISLTASKLRLEAMAEHTVYVPLCGTVIDIGCLGWEFAVAALANGAKEVLAVDPNLNIDDPPDSRIRLWRAAAVGKKGSQRFLVQKEESKASCLSEYDWPAVTRSVQPVEVVTLAELATVARWPVSVLKLDCEGAESELLPSITDPFAAQISIEFHQHTLGWRANYSNLLQWYQVIQDNCYWRRGRLNYWDTLLVRK